MMMMSLNSKQAFSMAHTSLPEPKYSSLHSSSSSTLTSNAPSSSCSSSRHSSTIISSSGGGSSSSEAMRRACLPTPPSNIFGGLDESLLARAEALAAPHQALEGDLLDHITPGLALGAMAGPDGSVVSTPAHPAHMAGMNHMHQAAINMVHAHGLPPHMGMNDVDADPRDLEAFAERFKQRRIKLGVTQADVGSALASLKIPGVGSLSQSTICRFESLTLSHNNMIALKPILQAWLEEAEKSHREKLNKPELFNGAEKKRKRTSIAAPEKRSLEAYFAIQPRPSSEKIAAIAEKLDLKKNVVRVWFCNQRQKQKRMKYSACV
uniref:POU domain protein n=1 Tax=Nothobranchius kuhntae TaxID=321403 RepID=A0A1A8KMW3_NOTKU